MQSIAWIYRQVFHCKRRIQKLAGCEPKHIDHSSRISVIDRPWMWIGGYDISGELVDITEDINEVACYDEKIDHEFLEMISEMYDVDQWMYIDAKTLEQQDFPTEGFIIRRNDSHRE